MAPGRLRFAHTHISSRQPADFEARSISPMASAPSPPIWRDIAAYTYFYIRHGDGAAPACRPCQVNCALFYFATMPPYFSRAYRPLPHATPMPAPISATMMISPRDSISRFLADTIRLSRRFRPAFRDLLARQCDGFAGGLAARFSMLGLPRGVISRLSALKMPTFPRFHYIASDAALAGRGVGILGDDILLVDAPAIIISRYSVRTISPHIEPFQR